MAYREPSRPAPRAPSGPTFTFRRYDWRFAAGISAVAIACVVGGLALYRPVTLDCRRYVSGTDGRCELVTSGVRVWEREEVWEVAVQEANLGKGGPQPTLGVMVASRQMHWFRLGSTNAEVEREWRAFRSTTEPRVYTVTLDRSLYFVIGFGGFGLMIFCIGMAFEWRNRVIVDRERGTLEIVWRGLFIAQRETFGLETIEKVDAKQMGDSELFYALRLHVDGKPKHVAEGPKRPVQDVARSLGVIVRSFKEEAARRAQGE